MSSVAAATARPSRPAPPSQAELQASRSAGVPWKLLMDTYGLSRTRLWEILTGQGSRRGEGRKMLTSTSGDLRANPTLFIAVARGRD